MGPVSNLVPIGSEQWERGHPPTSSLSASAYQALKWKILSLEIPQGVLFREEDLCKLLGYGRSPVHQALHRLNHDGLVDILPRKGIVVRTISPSGINHLIEARLPIECEIVRLAVVRAQLEKIKKLETRLMSGRDLLARGDREGLLTLDRDFHRGIAECAGNPTLLEVQENLHQRSMILWHVSIATDGREYSAVQEEHERILDRIAARDPDGAVEAIKRHLEPFLRPLGPNV